MAGRIRTCERITLQSVAFLLLFAANFLGGIREAASCDLLDQYNDYSGRDFDSSNVDYSKSTVNSAAECLSICNADCTCVAYSVESTDLTCYIYTSLFGNVPNFSSSTLHIRKDAESCKLHYGYDVQDGRDFNLQKTDQVIFPNSTVEECKSTCDANCGCVAYGFSTEPLACYLYASLTGTVQVYANSKLHIRRTSGKSNNVGAIVGGVIGGIVGLLLIVGCIICICCVIKRKQANLAKPATGPYTTSV